jgi:glycerate-2-kinase
MPVIGYLDSRSPEASGQTARDVPGDDPSVIASGPTATTREDALGVGTPFGWRSWLAGERTVAPVQRDKTASSSLPSLRWSVTAIRLDEGQVSKVN